MKGITSAVWAPLHGQHNHLRARTKALEMANAKYTLESARALYSGGVEVIIRVSTERTERIESAILTHDAALRLAAAIVVAANHHIQPSPAGTGEGT